MFDLKNYRRVMFGSTKYWCIIWRKTDLRFQLWHQELSKFSPEQVRKSNNWNFDGVLFIHSRKCMSLKFTGEFCVMTVKNNANFEEELTGQFKIDIRNLTKFVPNTWKNFAFKNDMKNYSKCAFTCAFKNDMKN